MLKIAIAKYVKKHGLIPILMKVGDIAVKVTKSKKDDEAWAKVKKVLNDLNAQANLHIKRFQRWY